MPGSVGLPKVASTPSLGLQAVPHFGRSESSGFGRARLHKSQSAATIRSHAGGTTPSSFQSSSARSWSSSTMQSTMSKLPPLPSRPLSFEELFSSAKLRAHKKHVEFRKSQTQMFRHTQKESSAQRAIKGIQPLVNKAREEFKALKLPDAVDRRGSPPGTSQSTPGETWDPLRALLDGNFPTHDALDYGEERTLTPEQEARLHSAGRFSVASSIKALPTLHENNDADDMPETPDTPGGPWCAPVVFRLPNSLADHQPMEVPRARRSSDEAMKRMRIVYQRYAPDHAEVDVEHLPQMLDYLGFLPLDEQTISDMAAAATKFAKLDFREFQDLIDEFRERENRIFNTEFDKCDLDPFGAFPFAKDMSALRKLIQNVGLTPLRVTVEESLEVVDPNKKGFINADQFEHLMAVYRVTEGFSRVELSDLRRVFNRFCSQAKASNTKILEVEFLIPAFKHMFGAQIANLVENIKPDVELFLRGGRPELQAIAEKAAGQPEVNSLASQAFNMSDEGLVFHEFLLWARRLREMELEDYRDKFDDAAEGSKELDTDNLQDAIASLGYSPLRKVVQDTLRQVGQEEADCLGFEEFLEVMVHFRTVGGYSRQEIGELSDVFNLYCKEGAGEIATMDLMDMMRHMGLVISFNDLQKMVRIVDYNGMNVVDFREFVSVMRLYREKDIANLRDSFDEHSYEDVVPLLPASSMKKVLANIGYKMSDEEMRSTLLEVGNPMSFDFDECAEFVEQFRQAHLAPRRRVAGYDDDQLERFEKAFKVYDEDSSGTIEKRELEKLLIDLKIKLRTVDDQKELLKKIDAARIAAQKAGVEPHLIGEMGNPVITFHALLHFLRQLHNEDDRKEFHSESSVFEECKFLAHEVSEFRQVFDTLATVSGHSAKVSSSGREAALYGRGTVTTIPKPVNDIDATHYLLDEAVERVTQRLGLVMDEDETQKLEDKLKSFQEDGRPGLDFPDFLRLMRWFLDTNFCNINEITE